MTPTLAYENSFRTGLFLLNEITTLLGFFMDSYRISTYFGKFVVLELFADSKTGRGLHHIVAVSLRSFNYLLIASFAKEKTTRNSACRT
jgi:hypothetical protein